MGLKSSSRQDSLSPPLLEEEEEEKEEEEDRRDCSSARTPFAVSCVGVSRSVGLVGRSVG